MNSKNKFYFIFLFYLSLAQHYLKNIKLIKNKNDKNIYIKKDF